MIWAEPIHVHLGFEPGILDGGSARAPAGSGDHQAGPLGDADPGLAAPGGTPRRAPPRGGAGRDDLARRTLRSWPCREPEASDRARVDRSTDRRPGVGGDRRRRSRASRSAGRASRPGLSSAHGRRANIGRAAPGSCHGSHRRDLARPDRVSRRVGAPEAARRGARDRGGPGHPPAPGARRRPDPREERRRGARPGATARAAQARHRGPPRGARRRGDLPRPRPARGLSDPPPGRPRAPPPAARPRPRGGDDRDLRRPRRRGRAPRRPPRLLGHGGGPAAAEDRGARDPGRARRHATTASPSTSTPIFATSSSSTRAACRASSRPRSPRSWAGRPSRRRPRPSAAPPRSSPSALGRALGAAIDWVAREVRRRSSRPEVVDAGRPADPRRRRSGLTWPPACSSSARTRSRAGGSRPSWTATSTGTGSPATRS